MPPIPSGELRAAGLQTPTRWRQGRALRLDGVGAPDSEDAEGFAWLLPGGERPLFSGIVKKRRAKWQSCLEPQNISVPFFSCGHRRAEEDSEWIKRPFLVTVLMKPSVHFCLTFLKLQPREAQSPWSQASAPLLQGAFHVDKVLLCPREPV